VGVALHFFFQVSFLFTFPSDGCFVRRVGLERIVFFFGDFANLWGCGHVP
jgi:hypothetical protein